MAKELNITWSKEHTSKSNPEPHHDVYRQRSDEAKPEKIGHNPAPTTKINIDKESGKKK